MGFQINTNVSAMSAYRNLSNTQNSLTSSLEKLSSGLRINKAADDAAGLSISEGLRAQIGGLNVASRNAQDGISVVQTAEGALGEVHSNLQRLRDLAVQAGNDSNNAESRAAITTEATQLVDELDRISQSTNFNGTNLLDGSASSLKFQVGANGDSQSAITVDLSGADVSNVVSALRTGNYTQTGGSDPATATGDWTFTRAGESEITVALGAADATRTNGDIAATLNSNEDFAANYSAKVDSNGALAITSKTSSSAFVTAGTGFTAANSTGAAAAIDFSSHDGAQAAIGAIDTQITNISSARSGLGAVQNRFETAINSINIAKENLSASESRIRDTDMAAEMANFTRSNILQQAGTSMLAQANSLPQSVLSLLG
jgi:flagellin